MRKSQHCRSRNRRLGLRSAIARHACVVFVAVLPDAQRIVREDNQAALQIIRAGRNPTLRHRNRRLRVLVEWLSQALASADMQVIYDASSNQAADVFTKAFTDPKKVAACVPTVGYLH